MKFCSAACRFDCSRQQLLWNSLDQLPIALSSSVVCLRDSDGEWRQCPLRVSVDRLTNWGFAVLSFTSEPIYGL
ncbi:G1/S-specific cyclin-E protein [Salvia divinorum]|uniref:G1/S-specific cyclin-E protein n=1 Tax=Salvia divinorum TaxID=28513 RepID=A0ABD1I247_SALDI